MVPEEGDTQSDIATSHVKAVEFLDYVIMRECDRKMYSDVTVKRGAECNTDHQFLRASVRIAWRPEQNHD